METCYVSQSLTRNERTLSTSSSLPHPETTQEAVAVSMRNKLTILIRIQAQAKNHGQAFSGKLMFIIKRMKAVFYFSLHHLPNAAQFSARQPWLIFAVDSIVLLHVACKFWKKNKFIHLNKISGLWMRCVTSFTWNRFPVDKSYWFDFVVFVETCC